MLELGRDFRLVEKPRADGRIVHRVGTQLLEGDLPPERSVPRNPNLSHATLGVQASSRIAIGSLVLGDFRRTDDFIISSHPTGPNPGECRCGVCQVAAGGAGHVLNRLQKTTIHRGRQGSFGVTSMMIQFLRHQSLKLALLFDGQASAIHQPVSQRHRIVSRAEARRFPRADPPPQPQTETRQVQTADCRGYSWAPRRFSAFGCLSAVLITTMLSFGAKAEVLD